MKNTKAKLEKLSLSRETLRQMTNGELRHAAGADTLGCPGHTHGNNCAPTRLGAGCNAPTHMCYTVGASC